MRPGPTTDDLAGGVAVGARIDVIRGGKVLAVGVPADGVTLQWSGGSRSVPGQLSYKCPLSWAPLDPLDALNNFGQRSILAALIEDRTGRRWEIPMGHFVHTTWSVDKDSVSVTATDLMQLLEDNPAPWGSSPPEDATTLGELRRLSDNVVPIFLEDNVPDRPVPRTSQWGTSRTEAVRKLGESQGFSLRAGGDGALHAYATRRTTRPDVIYSAENGMLVNAPRAPRSGGRRPNRWYSTGTKQGQGDKKNEEKWTAVRTMTAQPYEPEGYGWITAHKEVSGAEDEFAVEQAADALMQADLQSAQSRSLEVVPDARIEVGDVVGVVTEEREHFAGIVTAYNLPLTEPDKTMRIDINVLEE